MVLRKITIDNSVRYVKKSEQTRKNKPIMVKNKKQSEQIQPISGGGKPNTRKQIKNISRNSKKFVKDFAAGWFGKLKWITNCYFQKKAYWYVDWTNKKNHRRLWKSKWISKQKHIRLIIRLI